MTTLSLQLMPKKCQTFLTNKGIKKMVYSSLGWYWYSYRRFNTKHVVEQITQFLCVLPKQNRSQFPGNTTTARNNRSIEHT